MSMIFFCPKYNENHDYPMGEKGVPYFQTGAKRSIKPSFHSPVPYAPVPVGHWDIKSHLRSFNISNMKTNPKLGY